MTVSDGAEGVTPWNTEPRAKCMVRFRPHDNYKGEFGFDWLRIEDNGFEKEPPYKYTIEGGYKDGISDYSDTEAFEVLKNEYKKVQIWGFGLSDMGVVLNTGFGEYYVPYLNLFPEPYIDIPNTPPYEAELKVLVEIKDADVEEIKLEYNSAIFSIDGQDTFSLNDKAICPLQLSANRTIKITCKKEVRTRLDGEICAYAYFKDWRGDIKKALAGKIQVGVNDKRSIKEVKIVLVHVTTNITGNDRKTGEFSTEEQKQLRQTLHQALVRPLISTATLDLSNNPRLKTGGIYVNRRNILRRSGADSLVKYLKTQFMNDPNNAEYRNHIPVFAIGNPGEAGGLFGYCDTDRDARGNLIRFLKNSVCFTPSEDSRILRPVGTMPHEVLHGFQLFHTHIDGDPPLKHPNIKYIYPNAQTDGPLEATDNVMSYNFGKMWTTWHWQWEIIRSNL
jgi:hypothetical protein